MNAKPQPPRPPHPPAPMITIGDIYYIVFRHKWKIVISAAAGLIAAIVLPLVWPRVYESQAKLLIKYVVDNRGPIDPTGSSTRLMLPDPSGRSVLNTELQILTSLDLAKEVATNIGVKQILGKDGSAAAAAARIRKGLTVEVPEGSSVIQISLKHSDPGVAQQALIGLINSYVLRNEQIHQPGGAFDEFLETEANKLHNDLTGTEDQLRSAKTNLEIFSVDDAQKNLTDEINEIQHRVFDADAELARHQAIVEELSGQNPGGAAAANATASSTNAAAGGTNVLATGTNSPANGVNALARSTNALASGTNALASGTNAFARSTNATPAPSADTIANYKRVCDMLDTLRAKEQELLLTFLPENAFVKDVRKQIADAEKQKKQMEADHPGLLLSRAVADSPNAVEGIDSSPALQTQLINEKAQIAALQRTILVLTNRLAYVRGRAAMLDASAGTITQLERKRKVEEQKYENFQTSLENSRIDSDFGPGKASGISIIQAPSAPSFDSSKMTKVSAGAAVVGILFGLGLAFLIELYIDHSVKRPADIESRMGVPLFLSIPYRNGESKKRLLNAPPKEGLLLHSETLDRTVPLNGGKITIGRDKDNTVAVEEDSVSARHCEIFSRNGEVVVKDVGSTAGTFVDGERIVETTLKAGQVFRVGTVEFRIEVLEPAKTMAVAKKSAAVVSPWDPRHALRPFYDTLRDRLITYFEVKNLTHNPKLVALTSCGERAGVTSTAAGLAAALSETGEGNVLLVDMNVERGAAHHFYKGHLSCGIDDALAKEKREEARVQENLYVVAESSSEDSLPRVLPKRFANLVPKLKMSDYDYIIFDMPPMSQISITPRLAKFMDMVMVVVESEKTDRDVVQRAVSMLTEAKANVGVVLNKRKTYIPERLRKEL